MQKNIQTNHLTFDCKFLFQDFKSITDKGNIKTETYYEHTDNLTSLSFCRTLYVFNVSFYVGVKLYYLTSLFFCVNIWQFNFYVVFFQYYEKQCVYFAKIVQKTTKFKFLKLKKQKNTSVILADSDVQNHQELEKFDFCLINFALFSTLHFYVVCTAHLFLLTFFGTRFIFNKTEEIMFCHTFEGLPSSIYRKKLKYKQDECVLFHKCQLKFCVTIALNNFLM